MTNEQMHALRVFKEEFPGFAIDKFIDFDNKLWVILAYKDKDDPFSSLLFGINKKTYEITNFSPINCFEKFEEAIDKREIKFR